MIARSIERKLGIIPKNMETFYTFRTSPQGTSRKSEHFALHETLWPPESLYLRSTTLEPPTPKAVEVSMSTKNPQHSLSRVSFPKS